MGIFTPFQSSSPHNIYSKGVNSDFLVENLGSIFIPTPHSDVTDCLRNVFLEKETQLQIPHWPFCLICFVSSVLSLSLTSLSFSFFEHEASGHLTQVIDMNIISNGTSQKHTLPDSRQ